MSNTLDQLIRKNVKRLSPFSSARGEFSGLAEVFLDANENPYENGINRYPDPYQQKLKKEISIWKGILPENIFLGNGSDEIIDLLVRCFCEPNKDIIRFITPSFGMYEVAADVNAVQKEGIALSKDFELISAGILEGAGSNHKLLFLCSPNNPSGNVLSRHAILHILDQWPGIVVIDEAYIDFANSPGYLRDLEKYEKLVILQTFSKAMAAAGIRLGMCFASSDIVRYLNKIKAPYNIGTLVQERAIELISHNQEIQLQIMKIISERERLSSSIGLLSCVKKIYPSSANFLLVRVNDPVDIRQYLLTKDIVVRDRSKLLHCEGCLRISIGTPAENDRLIDALKEYDDEFMKHMNSEKQ